MSEIRAELSALQEKRTGAIEHHAMVRARERYDMDLEHYDYLEICDLANKSKAKSPDNARRRMIQWRGEYVYVAIDNNLVKTFLPRNDREFNRVKNIYKRKEK